MMRSMKRYVSAGILFLGIVLLSGAQAAETGVAQIKITLQNKQPSCALSINGNNSYQYQLGTLTRGGEERHDVFNVTVTCQGNTPVKTALTAKSMAGTLLGQRDVISMQTDTGGSGPLLWLEDITGQKVKLSGLNNEMFCFSSNTTWATPSYCRLTPVTKVNASDGPGNVSATILFNVIYPA
ncbi:type 1 fimbrial protein [Yersinia enterocolitica]|nr:Uncharacterised protein [Yersinia enterocolitica]